MFEKFHALEADKQNRILNAAMKEFNLRGYKNASTNKIVKDASIGKGMLFHYFHSKKELYLYLYDYSVKTLMNEFYGKIDLSERDILKRLRQVIVMEFALIGRYPDMLDFVKSAYFEESGEVKDDLDIRNRNYIASGSSKVLQNIDVSKFKNEVDTARAIRVIMWTLEGISAREREKLKVYSLNKLNYDDLLVELDSYLDLFRSTFYK
ncbi:TetR/AcrR family transcriptional regulator [Clostridium luticellarii]|jgi:AcrR family transcriptional regulator|uniref:Transcriptional regulator BetI n=2 Tax=Clostridium luticellarii TaxID=1691940 RepID=A0A2T0B6Z2_9CLOT|nr:TetR/AcrR family transcriptional regulator [Clostridium luticellarii]MCI1945735.1 TetR/AcrR family transcriptional regulator [Clostridium luticellarii]MCI1969095.1 TetR/AcrR family transcriptional regulator [Clostridium luticellarii]MCI1996315.1 TetR/AcrR family transcriptional regulator [Clostridium luticellarii]MCI2041298.1 TetR/AcrR family transcriptional regulator [Clostridium luticellarii]PRR79583.1 transcriptional regulator BetI [Clostridium luticellarii]